MINVGIIALMAGAWAFLHSISLINNPATFAKDMVLHYIIILELC